MVTLRVLLAVFLLAGCAGAATETGPTLADATLGGLQGVVVTPAIVPLSGASVVAGTHKLVTDNEGRFFLDGLAAGSLLVAANATGYQLTQGLAEIRASEVAHLTLVLQPAARQVAYHTTTPFTAVHQAGLGLGTVLIDRVGNQTGLACQCSFDIQPAPGLDHMLVEATWTDALNDPAGPTTFRVYVDAAGKTAQFEGKDPLRHEVLPLEFGGDAGFQMASVTNFHISIYPDATWPTVNQQAQVVVTFWYNEAIPPGWSYVNGDR